MQSQGKRTTIQLQDAKSMKIKSYPLILWLFWIYAWVTCGIIREGQVYARSYTTYVNNQRGYEIVTNLML